jgi:hypothetical protein
MYWRLRTVNLNRKGVNGKNVLAFIVLVSRMV